MALPGSASKSSARSTMRTHSPNVPWRVADLDQ
jgi:hypothetical protein